MKLNWSWVMAALFLVMVIVGGIDVYNTYKAEKYPDTLYIDSIVDDTRYKTTDGELSDSSWIETYK